MNMESIVRVAKNVATKGELNSKTLANAAGLSQSRALAWLELLELDGLVLRGIAKCPDGTTRKRGRPRHIFKWIGV